MNGVNGTATPASVTDVRVAHLLRRIFAALVLLTVVECERCEADEATVRELSGIRDELQRRRVLLPEPAMLWPAP